jgi:16S rRNA (guanine527-N7)-methyltransferase
MIPQLPESLKPALAHYLELLDRWNHTHALTALPPKARREELLVDAAAALPMLAALPSGARVVDLGTGMGSPSVLLALARPDIEVIGLDSAGKKIAFLRQVSLELPIPNLRPLHGRAELLAPLEADLGTAKAVGELAVLAKWWARHGKPGSPFLAFKGPEDEVTPEGWQVTVHAYELPTRGSRRILELRAP